MPSTTQAYDALPSETTSVSRNLSQQDSHCEKANSTNASPNTNFLRSAYISCLWVGWKWESTACVLVLATPIIIFATLYPHSGQPLPRWPFKISINSLLSVYALVLKTAIGFILTSCIGQLQWTWFSETRPLTDMLHFDNATRGADGALGLIWRQRFRQPLTSLGCMIFVLAVAVDPLVQQLVRPVDCSVEQSRGNGAATLPRANVFTPDYHLKNVPDPNPNLLDHSERIDKEVENALQEAIISPGKNPPWRCSTGNCTFPETYGSIGICYSCQDTSTEVTFNATCSDADFSYASHNPATLTNCPRNSTFTLMTNYTGDNDIPLGTSTVILNYDARIGVADANSGLRSDSSFSLDPRSSLQFGFLMGAIAGTGGRTDWITSDIDNSTCDSKEMARSWSCQGYGAVTCSLQPCVQIYNATIAAGILEERVVESSSDAPWGVIYDESWSPAYLALIDTHCSTKMQTPTNSNASLEARWLPYNFNLSNQPDPIFEIGEVHLPSDATFLLENGCLYLATAYEILLYASINLRGAVKATAYSGELGGPYIEPARITDIHAFEGPEIVRVVGNHGHTDFDRVQNIIANISQSLTNYIRTHGGSSYLSGSFKYSRDVQGVAYHYATCLEVQWPWLSFPACLAILTTIFFLTVVGTMTGPETPIWKVSPLAWVLRAKQPGDGFLSSSYGSFEAIKERSTQVAVHIFDKDPNGPHIRMADLKDPNML